MKIYLPFNFWLLNFQSSVIILSNNSHEVILIGMSHIGSKEYYKNIQNRYKDKNHLILSEGVEFNNEEVSGIHSDKAKLLGLKTQEEFILFKTENTINSDININEMNSEVADFLNIVFSLDENQISALKPYNNFNFLSLVYNEVIIKRNNKVLKNIRINRNKDIIVPWGAIHLIDLERRLLKEGYKVNSREQLDVIFIPRIIYNFIRNIL